MVAHGLITGMLFFVAGSVKERYHTLEIKRLSGMLLQMPKMGWILGFCAMASLGLPGLAGFWGEFPAILAAWNPLSGPDLPYGGLSIGLYQALTIIAALGTVLAAGYLLWLYQRTAFGEPTAEFAGAGHGHDAHGHGSHGDAHGDDSHGDDHSSDIHDVNTFEWIAWAPLLIAIVVFGVVPSLMFDVMDPAVQKITTIFSGK